MIFMLAYSKKNGFWDGDKKIDVQNFLVKVNQHIFQYLFLFLHNLISPRQAKKQNELQSSKKCFQILSLESKLLFLQV